MKDRWIRLGSVITLAALLLFSIPQGQTLAAGDYYLDYTGITGTCDASGFSTTTATGTYSFATDVSVIGNITLNGSPYNTYSFTKPAGSVTKSTGFGETFSSPLASANFVMVYTSQVVSTSDNILRGTTTITFTCTNGTLTASSQWSPTSQPASGAVIQFAGPAVPAGFVLRVITCNTPIYNTPGGTPVGSNAILAGQSWFVNPTSVKDRRGRRWTEVFAGGYSTGFVLTRCVSGRPKGYAGS